MSRILFLAERYFPEIGGLARSSHRISSRLAELGHQVDVFTLSSELQSGQARCDRHSDNLSVHHFGKAKSVDFSLQQATIMLEWLNERDGKDQKIDLVWSHYAFHLGFLGIWFAKNNDIPSVLSVRGNDVDRQVFPPGDMSRLDWTLKNASKVISVSRDLASKVNALSDVEPEVLHNSVDSEIFCPGPVDESLNEKYGIRPEELVLIFTGELRAKKGLPMLIECFRNLSLRRPTKLLVVGDIRKQDLGRFQMATADLGDDAKNIICTGHISDLSEVAKHLRLADIFLLPSLWDGLPNSMLEAMAVGIPVVASDAGAICEVIEDGKTGIVIPRNQLHRMAEKTEHFLSKPAKERKMMTDAAMELVQKKFSPQDEYEALSKIVKQVARSNTKTISGFSS